MIQTIEFKDVVEFLEGPGVRKWQFRDSGIKLVNIRNLVKGRLDLSNTDKHLDVIEVNQKYSHFLLESGDFVMASSGATWGKIAEVKEEHLPLCLNTSIIKLKTKDNRLEKRFLWHFIKSREFTKQIDRLITGSAQPNFGPTHLQKVNIPLPPLDQQKKIAAILDAADTYRQKTKALITKYDALSQSLFLDMFGDPVTNPKGWGKVELKTLCDFKKTGVKPEDIKNGETYIGLECIEKETGSIIKKFQVEAGEVKSNKFWFDSNYILYGKLRPYLNKVANPNFEGVCSTDIIPIKPILKKSSKEFIISLLRGSWFVSFADEKCSGANLPRISPKEVEKYPTINPPFDLQNQFADSVKAIEAQKSQAETSLVKAEDLFNSLLQKAFKGELV
jgi:type I restriction enzyme S subunit